jgi:biopolymer transport protein ExbD
MGLIRKRLEDEEEVEVAMSPLIDCVFLLLIFFLVTTMMKKLEKQIPVTLPDSTSAIADNPNDRILIIGMDTTGQHFRDSGQRDRDGNPQYAHVDDLAIYLRDVAERDGVDRPIRLDIAPRAPFQKVIDALDIAHIQGFEKVGVHLKKKD